VPVMLSALQLGEDTSDMQDSATSHSQHSRQQIRFHRLGTFPLVDERPLRLVGRRIAATDQAPPQRLQRASVVFVLFSQHACTPDVPAAVGQPQAEELPLRMWACPACRLRCQSQRPNHAFST